MPEQPKPADGSVRWWEYYFVRYAMGTIVGGIVCYVLCSSTPILSPLVTHLEYLAAFGLVYCYIASAPILVFHAGRFLLKWPNTRGVRWGVLLLFVFGIVGTLIWSLAPHPKQLSHFAYPLYLVAVFGGVLILALQFLLVCRVLRQTDEMWAFYKSLSGRREIANKGGVIESYRHLREHGNSFFIVFLEVLLGVILVGTNALFGLADLERCSAPPPGTNFLDDRFCGLLIILVLWITPAVLVWAIATALERKFSEDTTAYV